MITTIFAKKQPMTGRYLADGARTGVTVLSVPQMAVTDLRTEEKNGYKAIRIRIDLPKKKSLVREVRTEEVLETGTEIKFEEVVKPGDRVNISGTSKGKGFAGVVKRHNFKGGPRTHGQSDRERAPGSSGSTTTPGRVFRGKRRAGQMGNKKVMVKKLMVVEVDTEKRTLAVAGSVPGFARGGQLLTIEKV